MTVWTKKSEWWTNTKENGSTVCGSDECMIKRLTTKECLLLFQKWNTMYVLVWILNMVCIYCSIRKIIWFVKIITWKQWTEMKVDNMFVWVGMIKRVRKRVTVRWSEKIVMWKSKARQSKYFMSNRKQNKDVMEMLILEIKKWSISYQIWYWKTSSFIMNLKLRCSNAVKY